MPPVPQLLKLFKTDGFGVSPLLSEAKLAHALCCVHLLIRLHDEYALVVLECLLVRFVRQNRKQVDSYLEAF